MIENLTEVESYFYKYFNALSKTEKRIKLSELIRKKGYYSEQSKKRKNVETKIEFIYRYFPEYTI